LLQSIPESSISNLAVAGEWAKKKLNSLALTNDLEDLADGSAYAHETHSNENYRGQSAADVLDRDRADSELTNDQPRAAELLYEPAKSDQNAQLILVDAQVEDYQRIIDALVSDRSAPDFYILTLHSGNSGIAQLTDVLSSDVQYAAIHLISHGTDASIQLGTDTINLDSLAEYSRELQLWKRGLTSNADFFIYGCEVAGTPDGEALITEISRLTQTDVAASNDKTGNRASGADWDLERTAGVLDTQPLFSQTEPNWSGLLAANDPADVSSGVEINIDGGNNSFLLSQSGLSQDLTQMTLEIRFEADLALMGAEPTLISYHDGAEDILAINYSQSAKVKH